MNYKFLTDRRNLYFSSKPIYTPDNIDTYLFILKKFNLGGLIYNEDDEDDDQLCNVTYLKVLECIFLKIEEDISNNQQPDLFKIIHLEHVFWFGFFTVQSSTDEYTIEAISKNFEFIYHNQHVDIFTDTQTNTFICNFLEITESELEIDNFLFFMASIKGELDFDGYRIETFKNHYILYEDSIPKFILPFGNSDEEKFQNLYNVLRVIVFDLKTSFE